MTLKRSREDDGFAQLLASTQRLAGIIRQKALDRSPKLDRRPASSSTATRGGYSRQQPEISKAPDELLPLAAQYYLSNFNGGERSNDNPLTRSQDTMPLGSLDDWIADDFFDDTRLTFPAGMMGDNRGRTAAKPC